MSHTFIRKRLVNKVEVPDQLYLNQAGGDQSLLLTEPVTFAPPAVLNPAALLPETDDSSPIHHCTDILAEEAGTRNDLKDQPWPGSPNWYTDCSSFVGEGKWKSGGGQQ